MVAISDQKKKQIQDFSTLELEEMKKKLKMIIEQIDMKKIPALSDVVKAIDTSNFVDKHFCIGIYEEIMQLMENMNDLSIKRAQQQISSIHDKLQAMHEREAREREEEEDAESLLDNL